MSTVSASVTVSDEATALLAADDNIREVVIHSPTGGVTIYVGGSDVTTSNGLPVAAGASLSLKLPRNHEVYAIVASSTQAVKVLAIGG